MLIKYAQAVSLDNMFLVERVKWVKEISIQGEGPRYYHLISS